MKNIENNNNIEKKDEKLNISHTLNKVKKIVDSWKEADKTYNSKWITNQEIRNKYLYFKNKYEKLKNEYLWIWPITKKNLEKLNIEVQKIKAENEKYYSIQTIASITFYIDRDNKKLWFDKIIQKLKTWNNVSEIYKNKEKLEKTIKKLKRKNNKTKNEKQLLAYLEAIFNYYKYAKENTKIVDKNWKIISEWIDIDLEWKDNKEFNKQKEIFKKEEKIYNKNYEKQKNKQTLNKITIIKSWKINDKVNYLKIWNTYKINNWKIIVTATKEEFDKITNNKEAMKNFINSASVFKKLWLLSLWKYLPQISRTIWDNTINYDDNFLWEMELKKVLTKIAESVWYKINYNLPYTQFINKFKILNKQQISWWYKNTLSKWESIIAEKFFNKFINNKNFPTSFANFIKNNKKIA